MKEKAIALYKKAADAGFSPAEVTLKTLLITQGAKELEDLQVTQLYQQIQGLQIAT